MLEARTRATLLPEPPLYPLREGFLHLNMDLVFSRCCRCPEMPDCVSFRFVVVAVVLERSEGFLTDSISIYYLYLLNYLDYNICL